MVLLSGGLDSATVLFGALQAHREVHALTIDYGQRHRIELDAARALAEAASVTSHEVFPLPLDRLGGSALTDSSEPLPQDRSLEQMGVGIPRTYVPARNTIFLAIALGLAEVRQARAIYVGAHVQDSSGYPDCRPEYLVALQQAFALGTKVGAQGRPIELVAPLIGSTKAQIIQRALALAVPLELTWSCYGGGPTPCGRCDSCRLRAAAFAQLGQADPALGVSGRAPKHPDHSD